MLSCRINSHIGDTAIVLSTVKKKKKRNKQKERRVFCVALLCNHCVKSLWKPQDPKLIRKDVIYTLFKAKIHFRQGDTRLLLTSFLNQSHIPVVWQYDLNNFRFQWAWGYDDWILNFLVELPKWLKTKQRCTDQVQFHRVFPHWLHTRGEKQLLNGWKRDNPAV